MSTQHSLNTSLLQRAFMYTSISLTALGMSQDLGALAPFSDEKTDDRVNWVIRSRSNIK